MLTFPPSWEGKTTLVVLAAGSGRRFGESSVAKHLAEIDGVPIVVRLLKQFVDAFSSEPLLVVNREDTHTAEVLQTWDVGARIVFQGDGKGTVAAMLAALPYSSEILCVVLGDLVIEGRFLGLADRHPAIAVWPNGPQSAVRANYGVEVEGSTIVRIVEKPSRPAGLVCGMGVYLLHADHIRSFARNVAPDGRSERGVTDLLAAIISGDVTLSSVAFEGLYVNVNRQSDLADAASALGLA